MGTIKIVIKTQPLNNLSLQNINTLRPRRNEQHFADDIFKCIFFNENVWISIKISLRFVPKGPINNIPALVQIMAWRRSGDKQLYEPMMVILPTHTCATRPQWVKLTKYLSFRINTLRPEEMADILQTKFSNVFDWQNFFVFWNFGASQVKHISMG